MVDARLQTDSRQRIECIAEFSNVEEATRALHECMERRWTLDGRLVNITFAKLIYSDGMKASAQKLQLRAAALRAGQWGLRRNEGESHESDSARPDLAAVAMSHKSKVAAERNIKKWKDSFVAAKDYICWLCRRKFKSSAHLFKHETQSEMHAQNRSKQYRDRAQERRQMSGGDLKLDTKQQVDDLSAAYGIGFKLLKQMGWKRPPDSRIARPWEDLARKTLG